MATAKIIEFDKAEKAKTKVEYRVVITTNDGKTIDGGAYKTLEKAQEAIDLIGDLEK